MGKQNRGTKTRIARLRRAAARRRRNSASATVKTVRQPSPVRILPPPSRPINENGAPVSTPIPVTAVGAAVAKVIPTPTKPVITIKIQGGNKIAVCWPDTPLLVGVRHILSNEESGLDPEFSHHSYGWKALFPLQLFYARPIIEYVKAFQSSCDNLIDREYSPEFQAWFKQKWREEATDAEIVNLLEYDKDIPTDKPTLTVPGIKIPVYPWQKAGMDFLNVATRDGQGVFLCDSTGLGKTIQVAGHLMQKGLKALIVVPAIVRESWIRKLKQYCGKKANGQEITAIKVENADDAFRASEEDPDVIVMSYAGLRSDFAIFPLLAMMKGRVLVLDEGHKVRNTKAKQTGYAQVFAEAAIHTIVVTATPLVNRVEELYPLLKMTRRLWVTGQSQRAFVRMYDGKEDDLEHHLKTFMVRRLWVEVMPNAPQGVIATVKVGLSNQSVYDQVEKDFLDWLLRTGAAPEKIKRAERCYALVQMNKLRKLAAEGKVEEAKAIIQPLLDKGEQIVVFCAFREPLQALSAAFASYGSGCIISGVSDKKRTRLIDGFQAGQVKLLCLGIEAGGVGIDLPAAHIAFFLDLPWTPASFEQGMGRLLRLGQTQDCKFIKLLAEGTIDYKLEGILFEKATRIGKALDEDALTRVRSQNDGSTLNRSRVMQAVMAGMLQKAVEKALAA